MKSAALKCDNRVLLGNCKIARDFFSRFMGLMGRKNLADDEAIAFPHCNSIHTFFMRIPIDVIFVDAMGRVVTVENVKPWRMLMPRKAKHVIEMRSGRCRELGIAPGMTLEVNGAWN